MRASTLIAATTIAVGAVTASTAHARRQQVASGFLGILAGSLGGDQTFDYVVVGAGTAGIPLAYRLSEDPNVSVALIESGTFYELGNPLLTSTPAGCVIGVGSSPADTNFVDWNFVTEPQTGASNRKVHYARGKCLGGSSARNFMIYQRGSRGSYQQWADNIGDQSYAFDSLLPYFKKSVQFTPPNTSKRARNASASTDYTTSSFSPSGGPLQVSYANYAQSFSSWMEGGLNAIGIARRQGFNDGSLFGTSYASSTVIPDKQIRGSSEKTFLSAARDQRRTNLKVFTLTQAKKILFDNEKKATGVQVQSGGLAQFTIKARKEVIVSAGAFQSPQLLMVSGIGPRDQLEAHNIPVLVENKNVGQNMWDHIFMGPSYQVAVETFTKVANDPLYLLGQFIGPYTFTKSGPLTNPVADFLGWEKVPAKYRSNLSARARSDLGQFSTDWPEIEYISGAGYVGDFANLLKTQPKTGGQYATILSTLVAPLSRGNVTITSADTNDLPQINPNWLSDPTDQEVAIVAYKRAREAFASDFMKKAVVGQEYFPGPKVQSDAEILKTIQDTLMTVWHAACTCKMGKADDPTAVVDPKARVIGVKGLRVVDASSFNLLPPGHPQSTVYVLAEKIADDIKQANASR